MIAKALDTMISPLPYIIVLSLADTFRRYYRNKEDFSLHDSIHGMIAEHPLINV
jgi:hypothetical protein